MSSHGADVTVDLQTMLENKSPALRRLIQVPTPEEQLDTLLSTPGITPAQADFAKAWAKQEAERREKFGADWARDAAARNEDRSKMVSKDMYDDRQEMLELQKQVDAGDLEGSADLLQVAKLYRDRIKGYERAITAIETTEETVALVAGDPVSHFYDFYSKYEVLALRLPTLAQALRDRENR